ncbi:MAG TPA: 3-hydroxyacyl-CoA dehydrogenase family protein [Terriglobales bacterium]|nr:3-hydroxyacyl-CoA dehydrogenase family protein [Terriglobales bacterium]
MTKDGKFEAIGVVGCGLMGSGIAQACATAGYPTQVAEVSEERLKPGLESIRKSLEKFQSKGQISGEQAAAIQGRLRPTTRLEDLAGCDLVIEAIVENLAAKRELFARLDGRLRPEAVFASNTSSLPITEIMTATRRPERFVGLHFFNPVALMPLVEVVRTVATDAGVYEQVVAFAASLGKTPVRTGDRSGFIVNRLLIPYLLDAVRALEEGAGSMEDIDRAMKLGCGYPMGPFTLLDFVGLDTTYYAAEIMYNEFRERRFAPPPLLKRMVLAGWHGRKAGRGFYDYRQPGPPRPVALG